MTFRSLVIVEPPSHRTGSAQDGAKSLSMTTCVRKFVRVRFLRSQLRAKCWSPQAAVTLPSHDQNYQHRSLSVPGPHTPNGNPSSSIMQGNAELGRRDVLFSFSSSPSTAHNLHDPAEQTMARVLFKHMGKITLARTTKITQLSCPCQGKTQERDYSVPTTLFSLEPPLSDVTLTNHEPWGCGLPLQFLGGGVLSARKHSGSVGSWVGCCCCCCKNVGFIMAGLVNAKT